MFIAMNADSSPRRGVHLLRERLKEETRTVILDAAEAVFAEQGYHGGRMMDIAARAGIAVGTVYNYFDDRKQLLAALLDRYGAQLDVELDRVLRGSMAFEARLAAFLDAVLGHLEARWQVFAILIEDELAVGRDSSGKSSHRPALHEVYHAAEKLFRIGMKEGALRPDASELYPALLVGTVRALFTHQLYTKRGAPLRGRVPELASFFLHGAAAGEGP